MDSNLFQKWPKIPRLVNEVFHITEKIDGTNGCIVIHNYSEDFSNKNYIYIDPTYTYAVAAQSRTKLISPENDNHGFAKWVQGNAEQLIKDLGVGYHYGEWWGKGIQRGYGLDHKRFSLFNPNKQSEVCYNVPYILEENIRFLSKSIEDCKERLIEHGSFAAPGYMKPEGLVIYAERAKCYWKVLIDKHE